MPTRSALRCVAILVLIWSAPATAESQPWTDPSRHTQVFVETEPGVRLEVLDWGGTGQAVLLLAGHGDTAHIFDDFAPGLTGAFHVLGVTRRGFGSSSQPRQGYDLTTMVRDIQRIIDVLNLHRVDLVGHSIAGDEMTRFALTHPDRVDKLVYLEAAYDRVEARRVESKFPQIPPQAQEEGSPEAIRSWVGQTLILMPEAEIRATRVFGADGQFVRQVTPDSIAAEVATMVEHPDYASIRAPVLAIYTVYDNPAELAPRYKIASPETRQALDQVFALWQTFAGSQRDSFRMSLPHAHIVEIRGASHYCFISNRKQVTRAVLSFLGRSPQ